MPDERSLKILVVDDHFLVREGVHRALGPLGPALRVLEAATCAEALEQARAHPDLDLVLLDLRLPDRSGLLALEALGQLSPGLPVVVLSSADEPALMRQALAAGASGFVPKSSVPSVLVSAIRLVLGGGVYLPPEILGLHASVREEQPVHSASAAAAGLLGLTDRQLEVLRLLATGKPNKLIARELDLSVGTVKVHVSAILRALGARSRTEAVLTAQRYGLVGPRPIPGAVVETAYATRLEGHRG